MDNNKAEGHHLKGCHPSLPHSPLCGLFFSGATLLPPCWLQLSAGGNVWKEGDEASKAEALSGLDNVGVLGAERRVGKGLGRPLSLPFLLLEQKSGLAFYIPTLSHGL